MGGAAGHMAHPFDLGWVDTGSDLLQFFDKAKTYVEKKGAGSVKIDGVNVSFKVVGDEHKEFAVDRGSLKPIDIEGITMSRVDDRFPEGHGMRPAIRTLLTILNTALPEIQQELEELGMLDDPSRFLNTEYVAGTTNVTKYDENFLAIHGLSQFYQKTAKSGPSKGNMRPGMARPEGVKAPSVELPYDPQVMNRLVEKLNPIANEFGFQVYGSVPTEKVEDIDFSNTLSQPFTVNISNDRVVTKSLEEWLEETRNPRYRAIKLKDGTKTHPLHKQLYLNILNGEIPVVDLLNPEDAEDAIYGAVLMHATRMLGNDVLKSLTSPMGNVMDHEGIVMRDDKLFGPNPVKITGEFIVGNLAGGFGDLKEEQGDENVDMSVVTLDNEDADPVGEEAGGRTIALVPGAFKPPTRGHLGMVEEYLNKDQIDQVVVLVSQPTKNVSKRSIPGGREVTAEDSIKIWKKLTDAYPEDQISIQKSPMASPFQAALDYIGTAPAGSNVVLGASEKGDAEGTPDWHRWLGTETYANEGVNVFYGDSAREINGGADFAASVQKHSPHYMKQLSDLQESELVQQMPSVKSGKDPADFHASDMRYLISQGLGGDDNAYPLLEDFVGGGLDEFDLAMMFSAPKEKKLTETSSMAGGNVAIGVTTAPGFPEEDEDDDEDETTQENIDLSMVDEIMGLIIQRGIRR